MKRSIGRLLTTVLIILSGIMPLSSSMFRVSSMITNYPNPFDSRSGFTTILYDLNADSHVAIKIYDLFGNIVKEFPVRKEKSGLNRIVWDGTDESGRKVSKGGYICIVEASNGKMQVLTSRKIGVVH